MSNKSNMMLGIYEDPQHINQTVTEIRKKGYKVIDVFTPFPIHGIEKAMGIKRSRLTVLAFLCGLTGLILGTSLIYYTNVYDWPMNIGGKPNDRVTLSFVPVMFEATILCTAFGMATFFFIRAKMFPGMVEEIHDIRQSDDLFIIAVDGATANKEELKKLFINSGATEVREKTIEEDNESH